MRFCTEFKTEQSAFFIRPTADQSGLKPRFALFQKCVEISAHVKGGANGWFFAYFHVSHHAMTGQYPLNQELHFAAA